MDKYFLAIISLVTFSILILMYVRISEKQKNSAGDKVEVNEDVGDLSSLKDVKSDDFILLE